MNQLFLGGIVGLALWCIPYVLRRFRPGIFLLLLQPVMMGLFALWAVGPDIPRLLGFHELYMKMANDPRSDVFFWHYTIDLQETDSPWYGAALWAMLLCPIVVAWRELYHREKE